jgi:dienelactone hydrolase
MALRPLLFWIFAALAPLTATAVFAQAQEIAISEGGLPTGFREEVLTLPGDARRLVALQVTLLTPDGSGPFPLAVLNHGASGEQPPSDMPRYRNTFSAFYFLSRGYAVAMPMMRGFAGSEGTPNFHGCDYERSGLEDARDIRAVIDGLSHRPDIDTARIVVGGQSFGGWNTLALGALGAPNVKGLVVFAGGMTASNCADTDQSLIATARLFGGRTRTPSIWFYGDNDRLFAPATWRAMYARYNAAGGKAELVAFGRFRDDAHQMLSYRNGLEIWTPKVDAFLGQIGLPHAAVYPQYLPTAYPPPTAYAAIGDVDAVPYLSPANQDNYRKFLARPLPRAVAISANGAIASADNGFDPIARVMKACARFSPACQLYAVDNDVVWVRPTPAPPATHFAALADAAAVPRLNDQGRAGYQRFLAARKPRAFVIASNGSWHSASRGADPLARAMAECSQANLGCQFYAVDDDVVWPGR